MQADNAASIAMDANASATQAALSANVAIAVEEQALERQEPEEDAEDEQDIEPDRIGDQTAGEEGGAEENGENGSVSEPERIIIEQRAEPTVDTSKRYGWRRGRSTAS